MSNPRQYKIPDWFLNRQKDIKDGKYSQMISNNLETKLREDLERLKKIRAHRGPRLHYALFLSLVVACLTIVAGEPSMSVYCNNNCYRDNQPPALGPIKSTYIDKIKTDEGVLVLTKGNYEKAIKDNEFVLVEFCAPWFRPCKVLAPEYVKAAKKLKELGSSIKLAKVDVAEERELAEENVLEDIPTLKFYRNGKPSDYSGGSTADEIVNWLLNETGRRPAALTTAEQHVPSETMLIVAVTVLVTVLIIILIDKIGYRLWKKTLNAPEELKTLVDGNDLVVVGLFSDDKKNQYLAAGEGVDDFLFGSVTDSALDSHLLTSCGALDVFEKDEEEDEDDDAPKKNEF